MKKLVVFVFVVVWLFASCSKSASTSTTGSSNVPTVTVNTTFNINSSNYSTLATVGGVVDLVNVGYRGILVYRLSTTTITAFDRTCTYDISDANGIVYAQTNGSAVCLDCNSTYNLTNGGVDIGPSTIGLKQYTVNFNPSTGVVIITN
jgi:hypothetical protein